MKYIYIYIILYDKHDYRFIRHDFPTETSPIIIAFAIFEVKFLVLHECLTIVLKSLSLYSVISNENGYGHLLIYKI